jgi:hypothetical protein
LDEEIENDKNNENIQKKKLKLKSNISKLNQMADEPYFMMKVSKFLLISYFC